MSLGKTLLVVNQMIADGIIRSYAICGAVAALNYLEPAATEDLDVLVAFDVPPEHGLVLLDPILDYLRGKGYTEWRKEGLVIEDWPVQFLPVSDRLDHEAIEEAITVEDAIGTDGIVSTRVLSAEHLVAIALRTGRPRDLLRINAFLEAGAVDLDRLRQILERHRLVEAWQSFCQKAGRLDPLDPTSRP